MALYDGLAGSLAEPGRGMSAEEQEKAATAIRHLQEIIRSYNPDDAIFDTEKVLHPVVGPAVPTCCPQADLTAELGAHVIRISGQGASAPRFAAISILAERGWDRLAGTLRDTDLLRHLAAVPDGALNGWRPVDGRHSSPPRAGAPEEVGGAGAGSLARQDPKERTAEYLEPKEFVAYIGRRGYRAEPILNTTAVGNGAPVEIVGFEIKGPRGNKMTIAKNLDGLLPMFHATLWCDAVDYSTRKITERRERAARNRRGD